MWTMATLSLLIVSSSSRRSSVVVSAFALRRCSIHTKRPPQFYRNHQPIVELMHQHNFGHRRREHQWQSGLASALPLHHRVDNPIDTKPSSISSTESSSSSLGTDSQSIPTSNTDLLPPSLQLPAIPFQVTAPYLPTGDQPLAIQQLCQQLEQGDRFSILRGITGTGKTFVMAHVIAARQQPTLVLCHNKTLAAQLCRELRNFLSHNAVELFVSYYNHYIPESFVETTGTYIAKKSSVNDEIDALRHRATRALLERQDVVVVASVSCIYGLGLPKDYLEASVFWQAQHTTFESLEHLQQQVQQSMLYQRPEQEHDLNRCQYQLSTTSTAAFGNTINNHVATLSMWPPNEKHPITIRLEQQNRGDDDDCNAEYVITSIQSGNGSPIPSIRIFPAKHHVVPEDRLEESCMAIEQELHEQVQHLKQSSKLVEAARLQQRVTNDLLLLRETGFCSGIENYSRHFAGRSAGEPPGTLMDYLAMQGRDWLLMIDESHVAVPQLKAMYGGDRARKERLVKHGFRLPSALDNRPLREDEFWKQITQAVFVSATPSHQELSWSPRPPIDMVIRPTFVCDPIIEVRPKEGQLDDLLKEIFARKQRDERTLVLALTKRDAEDLASYLIEQDVLATYIHSGLTTHERADAIKSLQNGEVDCLVGVNLLREGLDLPQVSLVAILNADSEGFLRSETSLLQTVGRAARNINGAAIFYANRITDSMRKCMDATQSRREKQLAYNAEHGCEMKSTKGSTMLSIFDLLKDVIKEEEPLEYADAKKKPRLDVVNMPTTTTYIAPSTSTSQEVETDHIPSKPGVYFWKDANDKILYVGKAKKLRNRVKSYLSPQAKHSSRIKAMLAKATQIDFVLTPSDRDALILESNLIKHHQPPYNVLLKDDEAYPYICASIGDAYPRFFIAPRRQEGTKAAKYRYFGPYPHFREINAILEGIEDKYELRAKSFAARHGGGNKAEYDNHFQHVLTEVFERKGAPGDIESLTGMRNVFEEASVLFESKWNECRDVVAIGKDPGDNKKAIVHVIQLRDGMVAGRFSYSCELPSGISGEEEYSALIETVLEKQHYPSGERSRDGRTSFFPDEILVQYAIDSTELKKIIRTLRKEQEPDRCGSVVVRTVTSRGQRKETDFRAMQFAKENVMQVIAQKTFENTHGATATSLDGTASRELGALLSLESAPNRIECYDISHTQGEFTVGSRVVFEGGKPAPHLYRRFNIKTVAGVDDYASLTEVLERRFRRAWVNGSGGNVPKDNPWSLPDLVVIDGGRGQLGAAIKGMARADVYPKLTNPSRPAEESDVFESGVPSESLDGARKASIPVIALAKDKEEVFVPYRSDPVNQTSDSPALLLLRSLRDESHRFALSAHRKRRQVVL